MVVGRRWWSTTSKWEALRSFWALSGLHKHVKDFCLLGNNRCRSLSRSVMREAENNRSLSWITVSRGFLRRVM